MSQATRGLACAFLAAFPATAAAGDDGAAPTREIALFEGLPELVAPPSRPVADGILAPPLAPTRPSPSDGEIRRWMRAAAGTDAAAAAEAKARLADVPPRPLLANAAWALQDRDAAVRLGAVAALRAMNAPEAAPPLLGRVLYEADEGVRRAMAAALGALPDPKDATGAYLRNKILTGDRATRIRTAEVMGATGRRAFVEILVKTFRSITGRSNRAHIFVGQQRRYIDDFDVEVTANAFALDPHIGTVQSGIVLDTTVIKIEEEWQEIERRVILGAIGDLGGLPAAKP